MRLRGEDAVVLPRDAADGEGHDGALRRHALLEHGLGLALLDLEALDVAVVVADDEASYVVGYYGAEHGGEMRYATFVEDVARLGRHFMEHSDVGAATARSGAEDRSGHPAIVRRFIKKLRAKLLTSIKKNGEYERCLVNQIRDPSYHHLALVSANMK